jgi:hypothetical protein
VANYGANYMQENKKSKYFLWGVAGVLSLIGGFKLFEFELIKIVLFDVQLFFGSTQTPPEPTPSITKKETLNCKNYKVTMPVPVVSDPLRKKDVVIGEARNNCDNQPSCYSCERVALELANRDLAEQASLKLDARTTFEVSVFLRKTETSNREWQANRRYYSQQNTGYYCSSKNPLQGV